MISLTSIPKINTRKNKYVQGALTESEKVAVINSFLKGEKTSVLSDRFSVDVTVIQKLVSPYRPTEAQVLEIMQANYENSTK